MCPAGIAGRVNGKRRDEGLYSFQLLLLGGSVILREYPLDYQEWRMFGLNVWVRHKNCSPLP